MIKDTAYITGSSGRTNGRQFPVWGFGFRVEGLRFRVGGLGPKP